MRIRVFALLLSLACLFTLSAPVWASNVSTSIYLLHQTKIQNVNLKPGNYRLVVNNSNGKVKVERHYHVVARVSGKWVNLPKKSSQSEVLMDNHIIQEVRFAGKKRAVKFVS